MSLTFVKPLEIQRPYKSFRFDVYSLKAGRRMTLYGKAALCQWLELEANSEVTAICDPDGHPKCSTYGHPNCSTLAAVI